MKCPNCQTDNPDDSAFCRACGKSLSTNIVCPNCGHDNLSDSAFCNKCGHSLSEPAPTFSSKPTNVPSQPASFINGRYKVRKFLGEGGKKKVYLAHDTTLDRDVAFALIKTENLDSSARTRIIREAQAMGRIGDHPNIGNVYDIGDHEGQPYIVQSCITGGDVEGLIRNAPDHKLPLDRVIDIARAVCRGLEFAHARNIIHRDIKPGNVMLTEDGTARIVDFGLAVAMDMSRLTRSGMMVGTVSYMPPEQAMGGQVTAKADLYSLGAMLYEMVTGRPPFVGDDSISIIGQHINTPPVSPSWHRADLPPSLETLILQLLEKDPAKRPESASVVRQALESITAGKAEETMVEASLSVENPLYRRVFVGRESELKQLQSAFDGAVSGKGSLMMVVGEPGIGKTAICEQLSTYVTLRGGRTLLGHCYEEGSLSLPYLAFVESLRSYVMTRPVKELREELGTEAGDVARIVSEIREKLRIKPKPKTDPEEERYRLMQGVTNFLANAASVQPMMIVLEDLHDADKGTLDMLTHVSRNLGGTRLLIVGTYRDVEVDRSHPLSSALAELRRLSTYSRVLLRGLNPDEVRRMLESITRENVPWNLSEAVHRQTEGNPLFVQEVVRFLVEEGLLREKDGHWQTSKETPLEMNIPEGLRDVIGKRLSLISKECNQLLSVAAVIGREFSLEVLKKVSGLSDDELFTACEEAKKAAVVEERAGVGSAVTYRFAHAFFRQTLYEEIIAPKRIRLHQQVARALEEIYANRLEEHATELAEHFSYSSDAVDLEKAVKYGSMAAKRASVVYAYSESVRLLEQALKVQEIIVPDDKGKRCDLLLALCDALYLIADTRRLLEVEAPAAFALAESLGDGSRAVRACMSALYSIITEQASFATPEAGEWAERADRYALPGTIERAYANMALGAREYWTGSKTQGLLMLENSFKLARDIGDQNDIWLISQIFLWHLGSPQHIEKRMSIGQELWAGSHAGLNVNSSYALFWIIGASLTMGRHKFAEEVLSELHTIAESTGHITTELVYESVDVILAVTDGRLEEAMDMATSMRTRGEETGISTLAHIFAASGNRARLYLGTSLETLGREIPLGPAEEIAVPCLVQALLGRKEEVSEILDKNVVNHPGIGTIEDAMPFWVDILYLEAAVLVGHRRSAELLLKCFSDAGLCFTEFLPTCVPRHLGGAAALLGRYDEARKYYQEAIKICTDMPFRPELALSKLQFAELLLEHYPDEKNAALEHLDFAIKEFREMKMQPSLERALRHKEILKA